MREAGARNTVAAVVLAATVGACGSPSPSPVATPTPCATVLTVTDDGGDFYSYTLVGVGVHGPLGPGPTPPTEVATDLTIVVADVKAAGPAFWTTPDGNEPAHLGGIGPLWNLAWTPLDIDVTQVLHGSASPGHRRVLVSGGRIGCVVLEYRLAPRVDAGRRYVLFLGSAFDYDWRVLPESSLAFGWPMAADGTINVGTSSITLPELVERIGKLPNPSPSALPSASP